MQIAGAAASLGAARDTEWYTTLQTIGETLGETVQLTLGTPDGAKPLNGNVWKQTIAAASA